MGELAFLKLGGSLITEKDRQRTPRMDVLNRLAREIAQACHDNPDLKLVIGHGSGSFGHWSAGLYQTHQGVKSQQEWMGFQEVWRDARRLNDLVIDALDSAGVRVMSFPPSACAQVEQGDSIQWNMATMRSALRHGLVPLVYGDVVFDEKRGGTILSTETVFCYLAEHLQPQRILLAGIEPGVWRDFPEKTGLFTSISRATLPALETSLGGSASPDVTGGMLAKVIRMLELVESVGDLEVIIFSGMEPGSIYKALTADVPGTHIQSSETPGGRNHDLKSPTARGN